MRRLRVLMILPAVAALCAAEIVRRHLWLAWPIATTAYGVVTGRRLTANDEADYLA